MICAVMQPTYFPWCGYFDLIDSVDTFVFLDDVKIEKSGWHVRNQIKSASGALVLSLSVKLPNGRMETMINQAELNLNHPWKKKHLKSIYSNYRKSAYFDSMYPYIESLVLSEEYMLSSFNIFLIKSISSKLGIETSFVLSSEMSGIDGVKDDRLVDICKRLEASQYLSPVGSAAYLEQYTPGGAISREGIELYYHQFEHPFYKQLFGEFLSHMSILDMLFNCGFERSLELIRSGRKRKKKSLND